MHSAHEDFQPGAAAQGMHYKDHCPSCSLELRQIITASAEQGGSGASSSNEIMAKAGGNLAQGQEFNEDSDAEMDEAEAPEGRIVRHRAIFSSCCFVHLCECQRSFVFESSQNPNELELMISRNSGTPVLTTFFHEAMLLPAVPVMCTRKSS